MVVCQNIVLEDGEPGLSDGNLSLIRSRFLVFFKANPALAEEERKTSEKLRPSDWDCCWEELGLEELQKLHGDQDVTLHSLRHSRCPRLST